MKIKWTAIADVSDRELRRVLVMLAEFDAKVLERAYPDFVENDESWNPGISRTELMRLLTTCPLERPSNWPVRLANLLGLQYREIKVTGLPSGESIRSLPFEHPGGVLYDSSSLRRNDVFTAEGKEWLILWQSTKELKRTPSRDRSVVLVGAKCQRLVMVPISELLPDDRL